MLVKVNVSDAQGDHKMKPVKNPKGNKRETKSLKHTALIYLLGGKTYTYILNE